MRDTLRATGLDGFPEHMHRRILNGLTLFDDAVWYRENTGLAGGSYLFTVRIGDLLRAGLIWPDIDWLLSQGYVALLEQTRNTGQPPRGSLGDAGDYRGLILTELGEAEFACLRHCSSGETGPLAANGDSSFRLQPQIRYDSGIRELLLAGTIILRLAETATNLHNVLNTFEVYEWRRWIPSPFSNASAKAQKARDAVHKLNALQDPVVIEFHSGRKGLTIRYELTEDALDHDRSRLSTKPR